MSSSVQLGKLPPLRYYEAVKVKLADYLPTALPTAPTTAIQWGRGITFGVFLNDRLPDCTIAAWAHAEQIHSTRSGRPERPTDEAVLNLFSRTGQEQGLSNDQGRWMEGVLRSLARTGMQQTTADPEGAVALEKILGYAAVNPLDRVEVRTAIWLFGGIYVGAALPLSSSRTWQLGRFSCAAAGDPSAAPGSWGGHAMWASAVNTTGPVLVTWGRRVQASWCWWNRYVDEAWAVLSDDWTDPARKAPSGFRQDELVAALTDLNR